jgi:hypothetical protein
MKFPTESNNKKCSKHFQTTNQQWILGLAIFETNSSLEMWVQFLLHRPTVELSPGFSTTATITVP